MRPPPKSTPATTPSRQRDRIFTDSASAPASGNLKTREQVRTALDKILMVTLDADAIKVSAAADGIFPLITDLPAERMSPLEALSIYKYQAFIEKRHEQLETAAGVVPVSFKAPERIEVFLFLFFIAVTVHGLIERQVREAMKALSKVYPLVSRGAQVQGAHGGQDPRTVRAAPEASALRVRSLPQQVRVAQAVAAMIVSHRQACNRFCFSERPAGRQAGGAGLFAGRVEGYRESLAC